MPQALCPIVVGRDDELALLDERLSATREGSGSVVFLVGEAGIGKSRLAREVSARARDGGCRTLVGRSVQGGTQIPLRPLAEALYGALRTGTPPRAPEFRPYRRALARLVPEWSEEQGDDSSTEASPVMLQEAFVRIVSTLARPTGSLLLVLEDLHWADADTLAAVEYLADNIGSEPVLCVATVRSDELGLGGALARRLTARRAATTLTLGRLSEQEIEAMAHATLEGVEFSSGALAALRSRAEGVPFIVEEMLSAYLGAAAIPPGWDEILPPSYRDLVRRRLERLSPEARRVVLAGAVLGRSFEWKLLGEIVRLDPQETLARLREAVGTQLLDTGGDAWFRFRHALVREALLAELLPPERADLALRSADVIEARFPGVPGERCERAADLREQGGDGRGAARLLLEAGRRAMARWALASAEATLERARELAADDPWLVAGISHTLLEALALAGRIDRVRQVGEEVLSHFDGTRYGFHGRWWRARMVPVLLDIARGVAAAGDPSLARAYLERAEELREAVTDDALLARLSALDGQVALAEGDLEAATASAETALEAGKRLEEARVSCEALEVRGWVALRRGDLGSATGVFQRLRDLARDRELLLWEVRALVGAGVADRCSGSGPERLLEAHRLAATTDAVSTKARIELELGRSFTERFERESGTEILDSCVEACRRYGLPLLPRALVARATLVALQPEAADAGQGLEEAERAAGDDPAIAFDAAAAGVVESLVAGDREEAVRRLDRAVEHLHAGPPSMPRSVPGLWALIHADRDESRRRVAATPDAASRATEGYLALAGAVALGRGGRADEALGRFREADRLMEAFPWHRHVGRLLTAEWAAQAGWGDPATWARESLAFFEPAGHRGLADAARRVLRHLGEPVPRRGRGEAKVPLGLRALGVTSREMDVLTLVAEGLPNARIAERLYLSRRTVETHVGSLMRKTGKESRQELAALFADVSDEPVAPL